jgi:hypothetical protein
VRKCEKGGDGQGVTDKNFSVLAEKWGKEGLKMMNVCACERK